jgi:hypothetical protein
MFLYGYIIILALRTFLSVFSFGVFKALGNMDFVDSAIVGGFAVYGCRKAFMLHPALCILVFLAVLILMLFIQQFTVGFWIVAVLFSVGYGALGAFLTWDDGQDMIWVSVIGFLVTVFCLALHIPHHKKYGKRE